MINMNTLFLLLIVVVTVCMQDIGCGTEGVRSIAVLVTTNTYYCPATTELEGDIKLFDTSDSVSFSHRPFTGYNHILTFHV